MLVILSRLTANRLTVTDFVYRCSFFGISKQGIYFLLI